MSEDEVARRVAATIQACKDAATVNGLYYRVWRHLIAGGLLGRRGDRQALRAEIQEMMRRGERSLRRSGQSGTRFIAGSSRRQGTLSALQNEDKDEPRITELERFPGLKRTIASDNCSAGEERL
jgi:hypothetical protein